MQSPIFSLLNPIVSNLAGAKIRQRWMLGCLSLLIVPSIAFGDCQTHYDKAVSLLDTTTQHANHNEKTNPDAFSTEFKTLVTSLQTEKCMPQLMSLIQHIQSEQQKIPTATDQHLGKEKSIPITD